LYVDTLEGCARPMLQRSPTAALGILVVGEAPNWDDTFHADNGHLTYDADTDPTGRFMRQLLTDEVRLTPVEIDDVLFTNAALCLPAERDGKHPVGKRQMDLCRPWLRALDRRCQHRGRRYHGGGAATRPESNRATSADLTKRRR
jgi:hypothetical protein